MPKNVVTFISLVILLTLGITGTVLALNLLMTKVKTTSEDIQISTNTCELSRIDLSHSVVATYCVDGYKFVLFNGKTVSRVLDDNLKPIKCNCGR